MPDLLSAVSRKGLSLLSELIFPSSSYQGIRMESVQPIVPPPPEASSNRKGETLIKQCCICAECCSLTLPGSVQGLRFSLAMFSHVQLQINWGNKHFLGVRAKRPFYNSACLMYHLLLMKWGHCLCYRFNNN